MNMLPSHDLAIIIPCFNYEKFVGQAISSVISQNHPRCELVVVDDGSTDNSWEIISETGVRCYRVSNRGARRACLFGLEKTCSNHILFLDADDILNPGAISKILSYLDSGVAKLQFSLTRVDSEGGFISEARPKVGDFRDNRKLRSEVTRTGVYRSPPTSGNVFRRDVCNLLYEADYDRFVDGITLFAAPFYGDIVSVSSELGCYRIHGNNDSGLGSSLDARSIERDIARFINTMRHLEKVLVERGVNKSFKIKNMLTVREREFYLAIATDTKPRIATTLKNIFLTVKARYSAKEKLALSVIFILTAILPNKKSRELLGFRLRPGRRSFNDFVKIIFDVS